MSSRIQSSPPAVGFFRNLIHAGRNAQTESVNQEEVTLDSLAALPRAARLLLAHAVEQRDPNLMLLESDRDVAELISAGWLTSIPCSTIGIICFKVKPQVWDELVSLGQKFLTGELCSSLKAFRRNKNALYPWIWSERLSFN